MRAMILAAGRGERMRPLTDVTPKPLLPVNGKPLLVYHLEKLAQQDVTDVVINHAWLGQQIEATLGDGSQFGLRIKYSSEPTGGLETAGGIIRALPLLGEEPFWVINGDIFTNLDFAELPRELAPGKLAHLLMTENPDHNQAGDFSLNNGQLIPAQSGQKTYTYTGMGLFSPTLFSMYKPGQEQFVRLRPILDDAIAQRQIAASLLTAAWTDVGTPQRLQQLQEHP